MSDLLDDPTPGSNTPEFTVSEVAGTVRKLIEGELGWVRIRGEVGRVVLARSGHLYFDLKDDRSVLSCMTWKGQMSSIGVMPEEGMEVIAEGKMTASGFQSKFALNALKVAVAGEGALMAMLEKRKKKLAAEGLFDEARKRPLPYLPEIIGVVTSPQGAVIRDILHRLRDRFPRKVLVWPVAVQGAACAPEVARAIAGFNRLTPGGALPRPELIIVARGGGSVEDLWGFNEEEVARAAAASDIPLISAVGHETDTTLIDFVSDKRAPTPTAAAELAVPVRADLMHWLDGQGGRMGTALSGALRQRRQRLQDLSRALPRSDALMDGPRQRLDRAAEKLPAALVAGVQQRRVRLVEASGSLRPSVLRSAVARQRERLLSAERGLKLRGVAERGQRLEDLAARLNLGAIRRDMSRKTRDLNDLSRRIGVVGVRQISGLRDRLEATDRLRETLSYKATLERGYAVVRGDGALVTTQAAAAKSSALEIEFADGKLSVGGDAPSATPTPAKPKPAKPKPAATKPKTGGEGQGSLF